MDEEKKASEPKKEQKPVPKRNPRPKVQIVTIPVVETKKKIKNAPKKTNAKSSAKKTPKKTKSKQRVTAVKATPVKKAKPVVVVSPSPKKLKRKVTRRTIIEEIHEDEAEN